MRREFKKYPKIYRAGMDENEGILDVPVYVFEKIDGANLSVWLGDEGEIRVGSRNNDLILKDNPFNGAVEYCQNNEVIKKYLNDNPTHRLFGEWLVPHTITDYNEDAYRHFYLFDIAEDYQEVVDGEIEYKPIFKTQDYVLDKVEEYGFKTPVLMKTGKVTIDEVLDMVEGQSELGAKQKEGVVIKPVTPFLNKFGRNVYAKLVSENFKENNGVVFGGNSKHSETYGEMWVANNFVTIGRVQKIMKKLEPVLGHKPGMKDTARIIGTVYHDILEEEIWNIQKKVKVIDFKALQRIINKKTVRLYHDILAGVISVANKE